MDRPFRRYLFGLAERMGVSVKELLSKMDSQEISEWWAYDLSRTPEFLKRYHEQKEAEAQAKLTRDELKSRFKQLFKNCGAANRE